MLQGRQGCLMEGTLCDIGIYQDVCVIADDQWHWFAVVVQSSTMSMYVDGVLQTATQVYASGTSATSPAGTPFRIGRFFDGYLDEMQACNTALSADAVYAQDGKTLTAGSYTNFGKFLNLQRFVCLVLDLSL
jgi:hypothetical protein